MERFLNAFERDGIECTAIAFGDFNNRLVLTKEHRRYVTQTREPTTGKKLRILNKEGVADIARRLADPKTRRALYLEQDSWVWTGTDALGTQVCCVQPCCVGRCAGDKPFFSGLDTLPQGGGGGACLPFLEILGALSGITLPPPPGGGRPRVGWHFLGKIFVSKIFILSLSSVFPDLVSTLAVLYYTCGPEVLGTNPGRWGN